MLSDSTLGIGITYITLLVRAAFICSDTELFALLPASSPVQVYCERNGELCGIFHAVAQYFCRLLLIVLCAFDYKLVMHLKDETRVKSCLTKCAGGVYHGDLYNVGCRAPGSGCSSPRARRTHGEVHADSIFREYICVCRRGS